MVATENGNISLVVVVPVARFDFNLALKLLRWMARLAGTNRPYPLVIFATPALTLQQLQDLGDAAEPIVAEMEICTGLQEVGYFGSPNQVFKGALEYCERAHAGSAVLWLEADAVVLRRSWYDEILTEYRACGKPFLGDIVRSRIDHLTGTAVYPPNWRTLAPSIAALGKEAQGFDSLCAHETLPQAAKAATIQQIWRPPLPITDAWVAANIRPETALFHQDKSGTLINVLTDRAGQERIPLSEPLEKSSYGPALAAARPPPRVSLLYVTFARDMEFLRYSLASVKLYASGFAGVTVLVPAHECGLYDWIKAKDATVMYFDEVPGKGMLSHEIQVCRADEWLPNSDFIVHCDADCMFFRKVTPACYVADWRALMVREAYSRITNPNRHIWRECVNNAIGIVPDYDTMVRHPNVNPREVYAATREAVETHTGRGFDEYVLAGRNEFPQQFCEHITLGTIGLWLFPDAYNCVDYDHARDAAEIGREPGSYQYRYKRDTDYLTEWWSHGGIGAYKAECDAILAGRCAGYWIK